MKEKLHAYINKKTGVAMLIPDEQISGQKLFKLSKDK